MVFGLGLEGSGPWPWPRGSRPWPRPWGSWPWLDHGLWILTRFTICPVYYKYSCKPEPVKVHLIKSYCLPLMTCIGALELNSRAISKLAVCWNDAFRKIFHFYRWDYVKQLQYVCESIKWLASHIWSCSFQICVWCLFWCVEAVYQHFRRCAFNAHNSV